RQGGRRRIAQGGPPRAVDGQADDGEAARDADGQDGRACGAHRRQHREAPARYVVWGLTLVAGGWLLGLGAGCWGLTLGAGAGGSRRFDEESDSTAWRSVNRRRRRPSAGDRRGQECRQGGAARARAAVGGREGG